MLSNFFLAEIDSWLEASRHPNVMSVIDMLTYKGHIIIVSEYADGMARWASCSGKNMISLNYKLLFIS
jgi:hypothetical protein